MYAYKKRSDTQKMSHYILGKNEPKNKQKQSLLQDVVSEAESMWNSFKHSKKTAKTPKQKKYEESRFY